MPYNPGGLFSLIASYLASPGTTIRTEQHNPVFEDVAAALSSVLIRDGRAPMTGPLNMNGFPINNVVAGSSSSSVATLAQAMPIGAVIDYALKTPPAGWLMCTAQILLVSTPYQIIRSALISDGFPYGQDGSGNPKLPDARGCATAGYDTMGGSGANRLTGAFGAVVGIETQPITQAQLPAISPTFSGINDPVSVQSNENNIPFASFQTNTPGGGGGALAGSIAGFLFSSGTFTPRGTISALGSGASLSKVQPTIIMNKIIRVSYDV